MSELFCGDCLLKMQQMPDNCVDLVLCSPPYEDARTYGNDFSLAGQAWVDWTKERFLESLRVCKGLVAFVVEGRTKQFRYSATPALLMADLHRAGVHLRKPPIFHRIGIPGSGGPDWWRNDWEFIVCGTKGGKLPWSDPTACGHPPKYPVGGAMSNRKKDGDRVTSGKYTLPKLANPGNVIKCSVGGGHLGSDKAHANEAPYPERLCEFFIKSFCPPGGIVLDPFIGGGTTAVVAARCGCRFIGIDNRQSQIDLTVTRLTESA